MKFLCDQCNTKYAIADDRVRGRILKIRCKSCDHVITLREDPAQAVMEGRGGASSAERRGVSREIDAAFGARDDDGEHTMVSADPGALIASQQAADPAPDWYVSFDGEQEGPLSLDGAIARIRTERPTGKECYGWRPGFFVWLPIEDVPELRPAWVAARLPAPPPALPAVPVPGPRDSGAGASRGASSKGGTSGRPANGNGGAQLASRPAARAGLGASAARSPAARAEGVGGSAAHPTPVLPTRGAKGAPTSARSGAPPAPGLAEAPAAPVMANMPESAPVRIGDPPSLFASALAASSPAAEPAPPPLPPPPGTTEDLVIDEASGLLNLAHLAGAGAERPISRAPVMETFGGMTITPAAGPSSAEPVVVVAGPAVRTPGWIKWLALGGVVATLGLAAVLIYVLVRPTASKPDEPPPVAEPSRRVEDRPIAVAEPGVPVPVPAPIAEVRKTPTPSPKRTASSRPSAPTTTAKPAASDKSAASDKLSGDQRALAALYRDEGERAAPSAVGPRSRSARGGGQVSQSAIMAVLANNRRSVNLCYDRALKHDSSLKRAKLVARVKIGLSGRVANVNIPDPAYASAEIGQCVVQAIKRWTFPASDAEYEAEFPFLFQGD